MLVPLQFLETTCSSRRNNDMTTISWLHLTDLHMGMRGQSLLLPSVENDFLNDVGRLHQRCGPFDLVFFTGDLVQSGKAEEFKRVNEFLSRLWAKLQQLGSSPILLALPGNHDLVRPTQKDRLVVDALRDWRDKPRQQPGAGHRAARAHRR